MHCDLHENNVHFDGKTVTFFDWNGAFIFEEGKNHFYFPDQMFSLFPPEARMRVSSGTNHDQVETFDDHESSPELLYDVNAVHATVSAADMWAVGLIIDRYLQRNHDNGTMIVDGSDSGRGDDDGGGGQKQLWMRLTELKDWMMTENPYNRPTTDQLLRHPFFSLGNEDGVIY